MAVLPLLRRHPQGGTAGGRALSGGRTPLAALGFALLGAVVLWWTWRALRDSLEFDFRLYYRAGQAAWASGRPELQGTWDGTPFLAAAMALFTRVAGLSSAADILTVANATLVLAAAIATLRRLRGALPAALWWLAAATILSFGPILSTVWWKQFNIIALVAALGAWDQLRRGRCGWAAALLGFSVSVKPLAILLVPLLLLRRQTRRTGALAIGWIGGLNLAAQGLLALRAGRLGVLDPVSALHTFLERSQHARGWACLPVNFAPQSLLCRVLGHHGSTWQHLAVWLLVAVAGAWAYRVLRGLGATAWEWLAFACPLSVMLSPLGWAHYQVMLLPLFVLLLVRFTQGGAGPVAWMVLVVAFVLASLMWLPYGTLPGAAAELISGHPQTLTQRLDYQAALAPVAQCAQYLLVLTGLLWYWPRRSRPADAGVRLRKIPAASFS